ncbi:MAG TPA: proline dehydrogenase family protein [Thermoanaerobaculia bacterium]|nr:proline dehydrogenase family protein [Thermoanaerobaculia bacterium]
MLSRLIAAGLPLVPRPVVYRVARRYVAGVAMGDALATARALAADGLRTTTALLGERLEDPGEVEATVVEYVGLLEALERAGLEGGISVKPTHVGLSIDTEVCHASLERLVTEAARRGRFVRIDMEDHRTTDATLMIHDQLRRRHDNVGVVLQAYLKRTLDDVAALPEGSSVRLCKGIYAEPAYLVVGGYEAVRANFLLVLERLLERGAWTAIATHDEWLVGEALCRVEASGRDRRGWELQMLHGVAPVLRQRLAAEGHRIRVYIPYGPDWYDYSLRRLRENPRIAMHVLRAMAGRS